MPKLPGVAQYGMGGAPQPQLPPNPQGLAAPVQQMADTAERMARIPNPLQQIAGFGTDVALQLRDAEMKQQAREDAVARSVARTSYFQQADELFANSEASDITTKGGFDTLQKGLDELRQKSIEGYTGSDEGRARLAEQIGEAHSDYFRRALSSRSKAIQAQFEGETDATINRLAGRAYDTPSMLTDNLAAADAFLEDTAPAMSPQELQTRRQKMHGEIAFSAIDGLLNRGDYREAALLTNSAGAVLSPQQRGAVDRRIRGLEADAAKGQQSDLKSVGEGVLYDPATGEMHPPPAQVQDYFTRLKESGKTSVSQTMNAGQTEYEKERGKQFAGQMKDYQDQANTANESLRTAQNIDKLLEGTPTGTLPADIRKRFLQATGVDPGELGNIQAAEAESGKLLAQNLQMLKLTPVTESDRKYAATITPGFAQTPAGRKNVIYLLQRHAAFNQNLAEFSQKIDQHVGKSMDRQEAQILLDRWRQKLSTEYGASFRPPGKPQ